MLIVQYLQKPIQIVKMITIVNKVTWLANSGDADSRKWC